MKKMNVAVVGCGNISDIYLKNLTENQEDVTVYAVCDLDAQKAQAAKEKYKIEKILTFDEILQDRDIDIVLNLTTPHLHYELCKKVITANKHVYVEKPLSLHYEEGKELLELAEKHNVFIGCAPDTFMGAGIQTAKKIKEDNLLGELVGASAFMVCAGHESWHPNPAFYYQKGGGPMFDMGPYYLTALVHLLGSVRSVSGMANCIRTQRKITSKEQYGNIIDVEVPTHVNGLLRFENGAVGNIITSFDVYGSVLPRIEIYGTKGSMIVPDPNGFGGEVLIKQYFDTEFQSYPLISPLSVNSRGIGVIDMAKRIKNGETFCTANGKTALHVLEIMEGFHKSNDTGKEWSMESRAYL